MALGCCVPWRSQAVSNLDAESKLTGHYQSPWHLQRNVFHPSTRPPCVEELHRHAKQNLRALHQDQQQQRQRTSSRERRVTISISVAPPMPTFPSPRTLRRHEQRGRHLRTQERPGREIEYQQMQRKERSVRDTEFQQIQRKFERNRSSSPTECCYYTPWSRKSLSDTPLSHLSAPTVVFFASLLHSGQMCTTTWSLQNGKF